MGLPRNATPQFFSIADSASLWLLILVFFLSESSRSSGRFAGLKVLILLGWESGSVPINSSHDVAFEMLCATWVPDQYGISAVYLRMYIYDIYVYVRTNKLINKAIWCFLGYIEMTNKFGISCPFCFWKVSSQKFVEGTYSRRRCGDIIWNPMPCLTP